MKWALPTQKVMTRTAEEQTTKNNKNQGRGKKNKAKTIKPKNLQYEGSRWGRGIYKGKLSPGKTAARLGHPSPMILSLGHDAPSRLPP